MHEYTHFGGDIFIIYCVKLGRNGLTILCVLYMAIHSGVWLCIIVENETLRIFEFCTEVETGVLEIPRMISTHRYLQEGNPNNYQWTINT